MEKRKDPWGKFLEDLGYYNPFTKKKDFKKERIKYWLSKGAQLSDTVHNLLVDEKIISIPKIKKNRAKKSSSASPSSEATEDKKATAVPSEDLRDSEKRRIEDKPEHKQKESKAVETENKKELVAEKFIAEKKED